MYDNQFNGVLLSQFTTIMLTIHHRLANPTLQAQLRLLRLQVAFKGCFVGNNKQPSYTENFRKKGGGKARVESNRFRSFVHKLNITRINSNTTITYMYKAKLH